MNVAISKNPSQTQVQFPTSDEIISRLNLTVEGAKPLGGTQIGLYFIRPYPAGILFKAARINAGQEVHVIRHLIRVLDERPSNGTTIGLKFATAKLYIFAGDDLIDREPNVPAHLDVDSSNKSICSVQPYDVEDDMSYLLNTDTFTIVDKKGRTCSPLDIFRAQLDTHFAPTFRLRGFVFRWRRRIREARLKLLKNEIDSLKWLLRVSLGRRLDSSEVKTALEGYSSKEMVLIDNSSLKIQGHDVPIRPGASFLICLVIVAIVSKTFGLDVFSQFPLNNTIILGAITLLGLLFFNGPLPHIFRFLINMDIKGRTSRLLDGIAPRKILWWYF